MNMPTINEYTNWIKEKHFFDKNMDFLIGFWFTTRVVESKLAQLLPIDSDGEFCLSEKEELCYKKLIFTFILFSKSALELVIRMEVKNRKVNRTLQWFMCYFLGIYSPQREINLFKTLISNIISTSIIQKETNKEFVDIFDEELFLNKINETRRFLKKEPTDFLRGMRYGFNLTDKLFLKIFPQDIKNCIDEEYFKDNINILKIIIDKIILKREKNKFNFIDHTTTASIGMINFLKSPFHLSIDGGLKGGYEYKIN